jgi:hypothetical protein
MKKLLRRFIFALILITPSLGRTQTGIPGLSLTAETEICSGIQERMPSGMADSLPADIGQVYLWCKIIGSSGETSVKHVWIYDGREMATIELPVKSGAWRTWSAKKILPNMVGDWTAKIVDAEGKLIKETSFKIYNK